MKLAVTTPLAIIVDEEDVVSVRAEDLTGSFGIWPRHADFVTALSVSVVSWRKLSGEESHVAVRGGMLEVRGGDKVTVTTREAVSSGDLEHLETEVLSTFRRRVETERMARTDAERLYLAAIRQICRFVRSERASSAPGGPGEGLHDGLNT